MPHEKVKSLRWTAWRPSDLSLKHLLRKESNESLHINTNIFSHLKQKNGWWLKPHLYKLFFCLVRFSISLWKDMKYSQNVLKAWITSNFWQMRNFLLKKFESTYPPHNAAAAMRQRDDRNTKNIACISGSASQGYNQSILGCPQEFGISWWVFR